MNTSQNISKILCFGDSNVWGRIPQGERYLPQVRWTGVLQNILGNNYEIIEEGLSGRITNIDDPDRPGRNAKDYLIPCLATHQPLNFLVLLIGTGDFKTNFHRTPEDIFSGYLELYDLALKESENITIIPICPPIVKDQVNDEYIQSRYKNTTEKFEIFRQLFRKYFENLKVPYIDVNDFGESNSVDGRHMDVNTHKLLGERIAEMIKKN